MSPIPFFQRFGVAVDIETAKQYFFNRIQNRISENFFWLENFETVEPEAFRDTIDVAVLKYVANKLGAQYDYKGNFSDYHKGIVDFRLLLRSLEALYEALYLYTPDRALILEDIITSALKESEISLGVQWRNGVFWPSGAKILDTALVNDNLDWLADPQFKNILRPFQKGLKKYLEAQNKPDKLADVVTDMYEALETTAKFVTGNQTKDLSGNREQFVTKLELSLYYGIILRDYIKYANEYRHGIEVSRERIPLIPKEVEAFIYLTGLFIRLALVK